MPLRESLELESPPASLAPTLSEPARGAGADPMRWCVIILAAAVFVLGTLSLLGSPLPPAATPHAAQGPAPPSFVPTPPAPPPPAPPVPATSVEFSDFDIETHKITSPMVAVYTPMTADGLGLALDKIPAYADHIAALGLQNVMPAGSSGESLSLSVAERKLLAEAWAEAGPPLGLRVYMHVGSESLVDAMELAAHAADLDGVSGILCMTPVYFRPTRETLHDFLALVAREAPSKPFWFSHFPGDTGVLRGQAHSLLELAEVTGQIPNLAGVKFSDYDLMDFQLCQAVEGGKYNMLYGRDEQALSAMELGADTAVSSTMQYAPSLRNVVAHFDAGNLTGAREAQLENVRLCAMFGQYESRSKNVQKSIMRMAGVDVGGTRFPKVPLTEQEYDALRDDLIAQNLIDVPSVPSRVSENV